MSRSESNSGNKVAVLVKCSTGSAEQRSTSGPGGPHLTRPPHLTRFINSRKGSLQHTMPAFHKANLCGSLYNDKKQPASAMAKRPPSDNSDSRVDVGISSQNCDVAELQE